LYAERDSDIDFHDSEATVASLGVLYTFRLPDLDGCLRVKTGS
jgi:hypothetical protein